MSVPFASGEWKVARAVVFGYYDGPTEGLVELSGGLGTYRFDFIASDPERDLRVVKVTAIPSTAFEQIVQLLQAHMGPGRWPVWVPRWTFESDLARVST